MPNVRSEELERLIRQAELDDVRCYEITARARDGFKLPEVEKNGEQSAIISVRTRLRADRLTVRVATELLSDDVEVRVDFAASFLISDVLEKSAHLLAEFIAEVGVRTVFPYSREAIAEATRRVGVEPHVLGLFQEAEYESIDGLAEQLAKQQLNAKRQKVVKRNVEQRRHKSS